MLSLFDFSLFSNMILNHFVLFIFYGMNFKNEEEEKDGKFN
jgi:hypothetical protein